ncbi:MAG TPA: hypothetical protein VKQ30_18670 [Ktedonobacterales bacterium]|nr:hypothetical protein [Ktedonobacterales bacterium]
MRIYHSLFPDDFVRQFPGWETADEHITLDDYRANYVGVEQMLSISSRLLCLASRLIPE